MYNIRPHCPHQYRAIDPQPKNYGLAYVVLFSGWDQHTGFRCAAFVIVCADVIASGNVVNSQARVEAFVNFIDDTQLLYACRHIRLIGHYS